MHKNPEPRVEEVTEYPSPSSDETSKRPDAKRYNLLRRLGWQSIVILILTALTALAVIGFLAFLWFASLDNGVWHRIMVDGWVTRSVSIATLVLRSAVDLQAGVAAAMLAALVLESSSVRLRDAARISNMRAGSPQPRALLDLIPAMSSFECQFFCLGFVGYGGAVVLLFATTTLLQFSSTILLSDLELGQLPGLAANHSASYDFVYTGHGQPYPDGNTLNVSHGYYSYTGGVTYPIQLRIPTWSRNPPAFPAFAEYSKPVSSPEGVDDTGVLLRAFLPFADAQSRESIRNYSGIAQVLDSRVSCQAPKLNDISVTIANWYYPGVTDPVGGVLRGTLEPSVPNVERLWTPGPIPFNCGTFMNKESTSICQIGFSGSSKYFQDSGSLLSEFWNISQADTKSAVLQAGLALYSLPMLIVQSNASTSAVLGKTVTGNETHGSSTILSTNSSSWTISLCYSAWTTADLNVDMFSNVNRSEPITHWNYTQGYYTTPDVHNQMGELKKDRTSAKLRGILQLAEKESWIPEVQDSIPNTVKPFIQEFADLNEDASLMHMLPYQCSPCSALLAPSSSSLVIGFDKNKMFLVDYTLTDLFHQAMNEGSMARAVSSLITTLSSMAYYDQMPGFAKNSMTSQIFFTTVLFPRSHLGFWSVAIGLGAHIALVALIAIGFSIYSHHTLLGNHWQTIAQLQGPETEDLLTRTRMATDSDVKKALRIARYEDVRVGVRALNDARGVGLSALRRRDGSVGFT